MFLVSAGLIPITLNQPNEAQIHIDASTYLRHLKRTPTQGIKRRHYSRKKSNSNLFFGIERE